MDDRSPCSEISRGLDEDPAGTASREGRWFLIEQPGAWGRNALYESRLDTGVAIEIGRRCRDAGVRVLLIRQGPGGPAEREAQGPSGPAERETQGPRRWFFVRSRGAEPEIAHGTFADDHDLHAVPLESMAAGVEPLPDPFGGPLFVVCTHGRHDRCCADRGRPVVRALRRAGVADVWECSHVGGDRFAANLVAFPDGLFYGRVTPDSAPALITAHRSGRIVADGFRGRATQSPPVQKAEILLREQLGVWDIAAVELLGEHTDGAVVTATFAVDGAGQYDVVVRVGDDPLERVVSCHSGGPGTVRAIVAVAITPRR